VDHGVGDVKKGVLPHDAKNDSIDAVADFFRLQV
jgi:hypothetical protein